jgi:hypothetical protein
MAVGRFQVMAMLQAARAFELGLPLASAHSWGLNRAIFYAAAKRGFKGRHSTTGGHARPAGETVVHDSFNLGDEMAFKEDRDGEAYFVIGGKVQEEQDFERQIRSRFNGAFDEVWDESLDYVRQFDRNVLLSGSEFFSSVYRPKRDEFTSKWTELSETRGKKPPSKVGSTRGKKSAKR